MLRECSSSSNTDPTTMVNYRLLLHSNHKRRERIGEWADGARCESKPLIPPTASACESISNQLATNVTTAVVKNLTPDRLPVRVSSTQTTRHVLRIVAWHLVLYTCVVLYILVGGAIFYHLEGGEETRRLTHQRQLANEHRAEFLSRVQRDCHANTTSNTVYTECMRTGVRGLFETLRLSGISVERYLNFDANGSGGEGEGVVRSWTYPTSILFAFTLLTTIGYGNVAPSLHATQVFVMLYGAVGIPLFMISLADLGRWFKMFVLELAKLCSHKGCRDVGREGWHLWREAGGVLLVSLLFLGYIALGSALLPLWEVEMSYFDGVYFSYMSLTTIGLGDIVPRRMDSLLLPTIVYITIGLWLTTVLVEKMTDVFRLVHYAGRHVKNVKSISVWIGGQQVAVGSLIQSICRRVGMSDNVTNHINWDRTISRVMRGEMPPLIPIFPWHFADFVEHDPPLIDMSLDELNDASLEHCQSIRNTICNSPQHQPTNGMNGRRRHNGPVRRHSSLPNLTQTQSHSI